MSLQYAAGASYSVTADRPSSGKAVNMLLRQTKTKVYLRGDLEMDSLCSVRSRVLPERKAEKEASTELSLAPAASGSSDGGSHSSTLIWLPSFPDLNPLHSKMNDLAERGLFYAVEFLIPHPYKFKHSRWGMGLRNTFSDAFSERLLEPIRSVPIINNLRQSFLLLVH